MNEELYSLAFERAVLNSIIFDPAQIDRVSLEVDDFYLPAHQDIYRAMQELDKRGEPIDEEFIKKDLSQQKLFDEAAMLDILSANPISNLNHYESEIRTKAGRRKELAALQHARTMQADGKSLDEIVHYLEDVATKTADTNAHVSIDALMNDTSLDTTLATYETNLHAFNDVTNGGLMFPFLYLFNGERGSGKSAAAIQIIKGLDYSHKSLFISLEMSKRMIKGRFKKIGTPKGLVLDFDSYDIADIERSIRTAHKNGVKIVLIDSLMKIKHREITAKSRMEQLGDIADRLAYIKNKLDISIILIVQAAKAETKEKGILSVKGAGDVDYEADIIVQIVKHEDSDMREFRCTKNRANGREGRCDTLFDTRTIMFPASDGHYNNSPENGHSPAKEFL